MEKVAIEDVPQSPHPRGVILSRRLIGEELTTNELDVTHYTIGVDDQFSGAFHRHLEREEMFIILSGTATFKTEHGEIRVGENEAIYFEPGDWQLGYNNSDEPVTALLVGMPKELAPVEAYLECQTCGEETRFVVDSIMQSNGEPMDESRVCQQCGGIFENDP